MRQKRAQRRSYRRIKWLGAILALLLALGLAWALGVLGDSSPLRGGVVRVLVLGVDERSGDIGRSDTLLVATLDEANGRGALLSVPRDTRVAIEGHGYDKINHAYAFGGHALSQKAAEGLLGVKLDHYVVVNVRAFERLIDALGGIDLDVEKKMHYEDPWDDSAGEGGLVIDLAPGEQHLDGQKAVQYVRYRDGEGDIGRIARQQKFLAAVLAKLLTPEVLPQLPALAAEASAAVTTDLSAAEMLDLARYLPEVASAGLSTGMVPGKPAYYEDISYWIPDIAATRALLAQEIGQELSPAEQKDAETAQAAYLAALPKELTFAGEEQQKAEEKPKSSDEEEKTPPQPQDIKVMVINSSGINGAGAAVADVLRHKGFAITGVETGRTDTREKTTIATAQESIDLFYGMPFPCVIMEGGSKGQAVVNIGRDFEK